MLREFFKFAVVVCAVLGITSGAHAQSGDTGVETRDSTPAVKDSAD